MAALAVVPGSISGPFNADAPMFLAKNHLADVTNGAPRWTAAGGASDADITVIGAPTSLAYDGHGHLFTYASGLLTDVYFNAQLNSVAVDTIVLILPVSLQESDITVEIADDATFSNFDGSPGVHTLASWSGVSGTLRRVGTSLPSARVTGVRYLRIHFARTSGSYATMPRLGECFIGSASLLSGKWAFGGDEKPRAADVTEFVSRSRARNTLVNARGFRDFRHDYEAGESALHGVDDAAVIRSIHEESEDGTQPVIYIPDPSSSLGAAYLGKLPNDLRMPENDHDLFDYSFELDELPPFYLRES